MVESDCQVRVLLVDDEADFRSPISRRLIRRGFLVREAADGLEALRHLQNEPVDVVVMDVKMPVMGGLETLPRIKEEYPKTEVILLTGQASAADGVIGMKAGAFDYLSKPVELEHLAGKIKHAFDKIRREDEQSREAEFRVAMESRMSSAERLASLGTLAAGVAHEINNPLAIISESAGWLKSRMAKEVGLTPELLDRINLAVGKIESSVERAKRITHQLLTFARQSESMVEEFDLAEVAAEVVELTRKTASSADAQVGLSTDTDLTRIWSDPYQIRQVLINLVTNGLQAVESGGKVEIWVGGDHEQAVVIVEDNGPGIPKENMERIFEPFFSTKAPGQGTGLGLSVSRGIVEKLGGCIEVHSRLGKGSTFRVTIPRRPVLPAGDVGSATT
jgi:signal transduction histidine kinase